MLIINSFFLYHCLNSFREPTCFYNGISSGRPNRGVNGKPRCWRIFSTTLCRTVGASVANCFTTCWVWSNSLTDVSSLFSHVFSVPNSVSCVSVCSHIVTFCALSLLFGGSTLGYYLCKEDCLESGGASIGFSCRPRVSASYCSTFSHRMSCSFCPLPTNAVSYCHSQYVPDMAHGNVCRCRDSRASTSGTPVVSPHSSKYRISCVVFK